MTNFSGRLCVIDLGDEEACLIGAVTLVEDVPTVKIAGAFWGIDGSKPRCRREAQRIVQQANAELDAASQSQEALRVA